MAISMGSPKAQELQAAIQKELAVRGWSTADDNVLAEFVTIMLINAKTAEQITAELTELIGDEYDQEFTARLFVEAGMLDDAETQPSSSDHQKDRGNAGAPPPRVHKEPPTGPRGGPLLSQALSSIGTKRPRSPRSGDHSRKTPRTSDAADRPQVTSPTSPSAPAPIPVSVSQDVDRSPGAHRNNERRLLDRLGPRNPGAWHNHNNQQFHNNGQRHGPMQPQNQPQMFNPMMRNPMEQMIGMGGMNPAFMNNGMMPMDPSAFQDFMAQQTMMLNQVNQVLQNIPQLAALQGQQGSTGPIGHSAPGGNRGRGRGGGPGRGGARGATEQSSAHAQDSQATTATLIAAPVPVKAADAPASTSTPTYAIPERPGTPSLCKFGTTCSNYSCRYSHPSPVATAESGIVVRTEPCEKGLKCDDKDCPFSHVSKAALDPQASAAARPAPSAHRPPPYKVPHFSPYSKPAYNKAPGSVAVPCKFGTSCTRANCPYQHPEGRAALPDEFNRSMGDNPSVAVGKAPHRPAFNGVNPNRFNKSVVFNKPGSSATPAPTNGEATPAGEETVAAV